MNKLGTVKLWLIYLFFILIVFVIFGRMFYLQIARHDYFKKQSVSQQKRKITIHPNRGDVLDRNGIQLASSSKAYSIYLDPRYKQEDRELILEEMETKLGISKEAAGKLFSKEYYVLIKPKVSKEVAKSLKAKAFDLLPDTKRVYPANTLAAQLLGYVGWDNKGKDGLELKYDSILAGKSGYMILESDLQGRPIFSDKKKVFPVKDGDAVETTIDKYIQFIMDHHLKKGVSRLGANSAVGIIMDVHTGEIYAMSSYPTYDPNNYSRYYIQNPKLFWNRALFMNYEPGSVMKLFSMAAALEEGVVKRGQQIYSPSRIIVDRTVIEEAHDIEEGESPTVDLSDIVVKSLNVGAAKVGLMLGSEKLYGYLKKLGFGERTGVDLAGESSGLLRHFSSWYKVDLSRISFGYGLNATPIQLVRAVSVLANGGELVTPYIVKGKQKQRRERVFSKETSAYMMEMMQRTVEEGTAQATKIDNYTVGGKTGTAIIFSPAYNKYLSGQYNSTFVGVFPVSKPKFAMVIMVNDPQRMKYASYSAVPIFKEVAERVIRYLGIDPS